MTMQSNRRYSGKRGQKASSGRKITGGSNSKFYLFMIANQMKEIGLSESFIEKAVRVALDTEGVSDLMVIWRDEKDLQERNEIIADIQDMIDACDQMKKGENVYISFNDLDAISTNIRSFKDSLLQEVNKHGGINHLAELTGIPQPSLSRFFNTNSMPQRSTLIKIAKALDLDKIKIEFLWTK